MNGVIFSNENSGDKALYLTSDVSNWIALLLPEGSTYADSTIDLATAWENQVYFIFSNNAPTIGISNFIKNVRTYLNTFRPANLNSLTMAWLENPNQELSVENTVALNFNETTPSVFATTDNFNYTFGNSFSTFFIEPNTRVNYIANEDTTEINFQLNSTKTNLDLKANSLASESLSLSDVSVTFNGDGAGSFRWLLGLNLATDFKAFEVAVYYYYTDTENALQKLNYPLFVSGNLNDYVVTQGALDPLNIINSTNLRTYFAFTGVQYNDSTGKETPITLPTYLSINTGYAITLIPEIDFSKTNAEKNNLYPTEYSPRFVFSPQDKAQELEFYMAPEGGFYMQPSSNEKDENGQFDFLPGLSGTEIITFTPYSEKEGVITGDTIRFKSSQLGYATNFPAEELSLTNPGNNTPTLSDLYYSVWANIISETSENIQYSAQADGAPLFAKKHGVSDLVDGNPNLLGFYEPSVDMPQQGDFYVPMAPYLNVETNPQCPENENKTTFESQVLSKERKTLITNALPTARVSKSATKRLTLLKADSSFTSSTTPQGLIAHVNNTGSWSLLNLGQNTIDPTGVKEYLYPENQEPKDPAQYQMSFINLSSTLQSAFLTNQQFLVVTQNNHLGDLFSKYTGNPFTGTTDSYFNNKMSIEDWPFDLNVGTNNTYADYNNVFIFKFCKGSILDWVKNPKTWTQANTFNTEGVEDPANAYQQLIAISSWIQNYIEEAEAAYQYGLDNPESNQAILYEKFHTIINSPNWNGILALKVDIDLKEFPQQLKGLISGIDLSRFNAHHFGIEVNKVNAEGEIKMEKNSSLFGLINYLDTAYQQQLLQGLNAEKPVQPTVGKVYDFKVLQLQVLFENTAIKFFQSKVQLTMNELFSDKVISTNNPYGSEDINTVVLDGTYQDHDGTPVYVFENTFDNLFYFNSNLLKNVEITKIQFNTLTTNPEATTIESRFTMWGYLNYEVMQTTLEDSKGVSKTTIMDAFSFGNGDGTNNVDITDGLSYNNLFIDMDFNIDTPTVVHYAFDAGQIVFNSNLSTSRRYSLYPNFALQINNLVSGDKSNLPSSLGYLSLGIPGINTKGLTGDWYGLEMTLNMGTPGELAASLDFNATLLIAWSPGAKSTDTAYNTFIGIKLPGTSSNAKLLSLQGVLKLSIDKLKLEYIEEQKSYLMTLSNIALKFLGILKLPPGGSTNFLLFGNPKEGATAKSLGWYAAYNKTT